MTIFYLLDAFNLNGKSVDSTNFGNPRSDIWVSNGNNNNNNHSLHEVAYQTSTVDDVEEFVEFGELMGDDHLLMQHRF